MHRTYMLLTAITAVASVLAVMIEFVAHNTASHVVLTVTACLAVLMNFCALGELAYHMWIEPFMHKHRAYDNNKHTQKRHGGLPWAALRILDHFLALNLAWALLFVQLWAWDKSADHTHYFRTATAEPLHNVWTVWLVMIGLAFDIYLTAGHSQVLAAAVVTEVLFTFVTVVSAIVRGGVLVLLLDEAYEFFREQRKEQHGKAVSEDGGSDAALLESPSDDAHL